MNAVIDPCEISVQTFNKRAIQYQQKYMDISLYQQGLDHMLAQLKQTSAKILELGCGPGNVTKHLHSVLPNAQITAVDLAPNMIELAQTNCPAAEFKVMDCRHINQLKDNYDTIVCGFVLPYLSRKEISLLFEHCNERLNPGGLLYLSTMEGDYDKSGMQTSQTSGDQIYIYYHQAGHLTNALQAKGFSVEQLDRVQQSADADVDLIIQARKNTV